ncbi:MAG TPA: CbtA family protein [Stellaceae bacterium]|nr:CbtA family protein [Stellaceae bacterium]
MVGALLLRGMLIGALAGILSFGFLKFAGEPAVDRAVAFETQMAGAKEHAAHDHPGHYHGVAGSESAPAPAPEPELVSRGVQAGIGLFTGVAVYSAAFGGLFALVFALAYGRIGALSPRATAAVLAALGFIAVYVVPSLKYPANPPSVGEAETIGARTALYFAIIALSLAAMIAAGMLRSRLQPRHGGWNAMLIAGGVYLTAMTVAALALPAVNEVPEAFPAVVLWQFRIAAMGAQAILWVLLGLAFGAAAERVVTNRSLSRVTMPAH